jgi:hypothetical protein
VTLRFVLSTARVYYTLGLLSVVWCSLLYSQHCPYSYELMKSKLRSSCDTNFAWNSLRSDHDKPSQALFDSYL